MKNLKEHVLFQDAVVIKTACDRLNYLSIDGFIFVRRFSNGAFVDLSNQLKWSESFLSRYLDCKIDLQSAQDHVLIKPGLSLWSQNPGNKIWQEGCTEWGFHSGISIAKEGPNWTDVFCYYSRKNPSEMDPEYLRNFQLLEKFNLHFVDHFHDIIRKGERNPLVTPRFYLQKESFKKTPSPQEKFIKGLTPCSEPLSTRELECVYYVAKGNTAAQVGKILHISKRTVETHLQKAKDKLHVTKTSDLIKHFPQW